jgi:gliding motility-associated lipoprotein GldH
MFIRRFFFLLIATGLFSCDGVYREWEKESFSLLSWKPGQAIRFYPEIDDSSKTYTLTLGVRHLYGVTIDHIQVAITRSSPSGKEEVKNYTLRLTDSSGKSLASCAGNMCDFEDVVDNKLTFSEEGKYTVAIVPSEQIRGIMEFGFILSVND